MYSCAQETPDSDVITFEQIEEEFEFAKSLPESSRKYAIKQFGSIENYYGYLKDNIEPLQRKSVVKGESVGLKRGSLPKCQLMYPWSDLNIEEFPCMLDYSIYENAEISGITDLPNSCNRGACPNCVGKIMEGEVIQEDQTFFDDDQLAAGAVVICVATIESDVMIKTHMESYFMD